MDETRRESASNVSTANADNTILPEPYRTFQVLKSTALGFGAPQGLALQIHPTGGNARSSSPSYHSSTMPAFRQRLGAPPSFKLHIGASIPKHNQEQGEIIASIKYKGIAGYLGLDYDVTITPMPTFSTGEQGSADDNKSTSHVARIGYGRKYEVNLIHPDGSTVSLLWKGSKKAAALYQDGSPLCNGNLKLLDPNQPDEILALWRNRTDLTILGSIVVFAPFDEGEMLEAVISTCLATVLAERMSGRSFLGGIGKSS